MKIYAMSFLVTAIIIGLYVFNLGRLYWYVGQEVGKTLGGM
jgi:hypothetical protein